jgi:hypothetical protein
MGKGIWPRSLLVCTQPQVTQSNEAIAHDLATADYTNTG